MAFCVSFALLLRFTCILLKLPYFPTQNVYFPTQNVVKYL